jgi:predicted dehydrogenase
MIGAIHRFAARMDDRFDLIAGVFSTRAEGNKETVRQPGLTNDRCYETYQDLIHAEAGRADGAQIVAITMPNDLHYPAALACIEAGLPAWM